jgi:hypothetical protein
LSKTAQAELRDRINTIEESYEYFLAYAAQGLAGDAAAKWGGQVRDYLQRTDTALTGLADLFTSFVKQQGLESADRYHSFIAVLERDARDAQAAVQLVLAQASISSQLIDNLNASIHLRALLTDLFLIDESLKLQVTETSSTSAS